MCRNDRFRILSVVWKLPKIKIKITQQWLRIWKKIPNKFAMRKQRIERENNKNENERCQVLYSSAMCLRSRTIKRAKVSTNKSMNAPKSYKGKFSEKSSQNPHKNQITNSLPNLIGVKPITLSQTKGIKDPTKFPRGGTKGTTKFFQIPEGHPSSH